MGRSGEYWLYFISLLKPQKGRIKQMLIGEYQCSLDDKGRLNFPAKFREAMGENFIVTRWIDHCLVVFSQDEWERITSKLKEKSIVKSRDMQRFLYAGAMQAVPDKQGRILITGVLRKHATLQKEVVVIGVGTRVEIWDLVKWTEMNEQLAQEDIASAMEELDF